MGPRAAWFYEPWADPAKAIALLRATEPVVCADDTISEAAPTAEAADYRAFLENRCKRDAIFLGRLLGYRNLLDRVHGPAVAMLPDKERMVAIIQAEHERDDPEAPAPEGIDPLFLHLDPRGTYKSTLGIIDAIQWILWLANIRICILTATKPLAAAIVGEITDHFVKGRHETLFQVLFSELCIAPRDKRIGEFVAPNRTRAWREGTVMAFSIETSISGWHFDLLCPDDPVDTQNSATPSGIEKVKKVYRINLKTLMPWGMVSAKGTRYNPFDLWGDILDKANPSKIKTLIRSALRRKDGRRFDPAAPFPAESEVELLFPELLSYGFLRTQFEDDPPSFMTQFMNVATGANMVTFTPEQMDRAEVTAHSIPAFGRAVCAWRLPWGGSDGQRHAAGVAGLLDNTGGMRAYIVDCVRGAFAPSALAHEIVMMAKRQGTHEVQIEQTPGSEYIEPSIRNYAAITGWAVTVQWLEFQDDAGARDLRLKSVEPLIAAGRLLFSSDLAQRKEVRRQFENYGMIADAEVVDVVARVAERLPRSIVPQDADAEIDQAWELARARDLYDRTHGLGQYAPVEVAAPEVDPTPHNSYGLDDILGGLNG